MHFQGIFLVKYEKNIKGKNDQILCVKSDVSILNFYQIYIHPKNTKATKAATFLLMLISFLSVVGENYFQIF